MNKLLLTMLSAFLLFATGTAEAAERQTFITGLRNPVGMLYDPEGRLYIADWGTQTVSRYDANARQTVITQDVGRPSGLALDESGTLYIASYDKNVIYTLKPGQEPRVFATGFNTPAGLLWDDGVLYMANRDAGEIIRIHPDGRKELISKGHIQPVGIVKRADGSLIISCLGGTIEHIGLDGRIRIVSDRLNSPSPGLILDGDDAVMVPDYRGTTVARIYMDGRTETVAGGFITPVGLVKMPDNRLMVGDWGKGAALILNDVEARAAQRNGTNSPNEPDSLNEPKRNAQLKPENTICELLAHTGHTEFTPNDPPTFAVVSADDPIVRVSNVENRMTGMRAAGIAVEYRKYKNAGHGSWYRH